MALAALAATGAGGPAAGAGTPGASGGEGGTVALAASGGACRPAAGTPGAPGGGGGTVVGGRNFGRRGRVFRGRRVHRSLFHCFATASHAADRAARGELRRELKNAGQQCRRRDADARGHPRRARGPQPLPRRWPLGRGTSTWRLPTLDERAASSRVERRRRPRRRLWASSRTTGNRTRTMSTATSTRRRPRPRRRFLWSPSSVRRRG